MPAKKSMCDCATKVNDVLEKEKGYGLDLAFTVAPGPVRVFPQIKLDKKAKHRVLTPTFCPFCGVRYPK
jgi:hypothetical protein